jgi:hypothetical protein
LGFTHAEIATALGISINVTHHFLRQRTYLDPEKLDPRAQAARSRRLLLLENSIAQEMPRALVGDIKSAWAAIRAIKAQCHLLGFCLTPKTPKKQKLNS